MPEIYVFGSMTAARNRNNGVVENDIDDWMDDIGLSVDISPYCRTEYVRNGQITVLTFDHDYYNYDFSDVNLDSGTDAAESLVIILKDFCRLMKCSGTRVNGHLGISGQVTGTIDITDNTVVFTREDV